MAPSVPRSKDVSAHKVRGLLTTHLFNTNLHLRLNGAGVAFMSHEVDLTRAAHSGCTAHTVHLPL